MRRFTDDANETTLVVADPTVDRTITLPNLTGTVSLLDATETLENKTLTAPTLTSAVLNTAVSGTAILLMKIIWQVIVQQN